MNRSLPNVLFGGASAGPIETREMVGSITKTTVEDTVEALSNADSVILVVGYGMAVAKAQYAISDICAMLRAKGITVRFAIHPVAGVSLFTFLYDVIYSWIMLQRMPGKFRF